MFKSVKNANFLFWCDVFAGNYGKKEKNDNSWHGDRGNNVDCCGMAFESTFKPTLSHISYKR